MAAKGGTGARVSGRTQASKGFGSRGEGKAEGQAAKPVSAKSAKATTKKEPVKKEACRKTLYFDQDLWNALERHVALLSVDEKTSASKYISSLLKKDSKKWRK